MLECTLVVVEMIKPSILSDVNRFIINRIIQLKSNYYLKQDYFEVS